MGKIKGCVNASCEAHNKKITYKESETFCSRCGNPLFYVCKDCYTQLPDDSEKYCIRCLAKHEDSKDKVKKIAASVGSGVVAVGVGVLTVGKKALKL
ncbi:hypothetical protein SDC9_84232 [bioreactor metagenome]|uniref:Uncharacterized protein n=1 Tax=bioreactor metagenome TaxID=1076179 RepID=A0A644ZIH4_9ZZZZ